MDTITNINHRTARPPVRVSGTRVPAYFLGRQREVWMRAMVAPTPLAPAA